MEKTLLRPTESRGNNGTILYAGVHLIVNLCHTRHLNSLPKIEEIPENAARSRAAGSPSIDRRKFSTHAGVSPAAIRTAGSLPVSFSSKGPSTPFRPSSGRPGGSARRSISRPGLTTQVSTREPSELQTTRKES
jgi:hypothetical protein